MPRLFSVVELCMTLGFGFLMLTKTFFSCGNYSRFVSVIILYPLTNLVPKLQKYCLD